MRAAGVQAGALARLAKFAAPASPERHATLPIDFADLLAEVGSMFRWYGDLAAGKSTGGKPFRPGGAEVAGIAKCGSAGESRRKAGFRGRHCLFRRGAFLAARRSPPVDRAWLNNEMLHDHRFNDPPHGQPCPSAAHVFTVIELLASPWSAIGHLLGNGLVAETRRPQLEGPGLSSRHGSIKRRTVGIAARAYDPLSSFELNRAGYPLAETHHRGFLAVGLALLAFRQALQGDLGPPSAPLCGAFSCVPMCRVTVGCPT